MIKYNTLKLRYYYIKIIVDTLSFISLETAWCRESNKLIHKLIQFYNWPMILQQYSNLWVPALVDN